MKISVNQMSQFQFHHSIGSMNNKANVNKINWVKETTVKAGESLLPLRNALKLSL